MLGAAACRRLSITISLFLSCQADIFSAVAAPATGADISQLFRALLSLPRTKREAIRPDMLAKHELCFRAFSTRVDDAAHGRRRRRRRKK